MPFALLLNATDQADVSTNLSFLPTDGTAWQAPTPGSASASHVVNILVVKLNAAQAYELEQALRANETNDSANLVMAYHTGDFPIYLSGLPLAVLDLIPQNHTLAPIQTHVSSSSSSIWDIIVDTIVAGVEFIVNVAIAFYNGLKWLGEKMGFGGDGWSLDLDWPDIKGAVLGAFDYLKDWVLTQATVFLRMLLLLITSSSQGYVNGINGALNNYLGEISWFDFGKPEPSSLEKQKHVQSSDTAGLALGLSFIGAGDKAVEIQKQMDFIGGTIQPILRLISPTTLVMTLLDKIGLQKPAIITDFMEPKIEGIIEDVLTYLIKLIIGKDNSLISLLGIEVSNNFTLSYNFTRSILNKAIFGKLKFASTVANATLDAEEAWEGAADFSWLVISGTILMHMLMLLTGASFASASGSWNFVSGANARANGILKLFQQDPARAAMFARGLTIFEYFVLGAAVALQLQYDEGYLDIDEDFFNILLVLIGSLGLFVGVINSIFIAKSGSHPVEKVVLIIFQIFGIIWSADFIKDGLIGLIN